MNAFLTGARTHLTAIHRLMAAVSIIEFFLIAYFIGPSTSLAYARNVRLAQNKPTVAFHMKAATDLPSSLKLVWSDEFYGPAGAAPDQTKWNMEVGNGVNHELEYYTNKNAFLDGNGDLILEARQEVTPGSTCPPDSLTGSTTCQYTSARLNTNGHFSFTYGHIEARIKVPGTQGIWPAFWMLGSNFYDSQTPWPDCGEIDIMEHLGQEQGIIHSTIHSPKFSGINGLTYTYTLPNNASFSNDFHVFALDWGTSNMTFSVDGNVFFVLDRSTVEATHGPWIYDHPFTILLDNAVGGDWPGNPDRTTVFPQQMVVDYVRVYQ
jgi:beta-glucanase (GH16 family)